MAEVLVRQEGAIARVVLSNPRKFNAMTLDMWESVPRVLDSLDADPSIRLVVLEGDGDQAFVSGADISQFGAERSSREGQARYGRAVEAAYQAPIRCSKPVVAKIRGICMGGGLGLAAACDLRFARDDARFRMPAAKLGLGYGVAGTRRFLEVLGTQNALDIFLSARIFDAADALRMGFVCRVEPAERFDRVVDDWCQAAAANAPLAMRAAKRTINALLLDREDRDMKAVDAGISACAASEDFKEGARAFLEKRAPVYRGI